MDADGGLLDIARGATFPGRPASVIGVCACCGGTGEISGPVGIKATALCRRCAKHSDSGFKSCGCTPCAWCAAHWAETGQQVVELFENRRNESGSFWE